jgi:hypothetical protein
VVSWELDPCYLLLSIFISLDSGKCCSWVANICAEHFGSNNQDTDTSRSTESNIYPRISIQRLVRLHKAHWKFFLDFRRINYSLGNLSLIKSALDSCLYSWSQLLFQVFWGFFTVDSMPISYRKEVSSPILSQVGHHEIRILVHLVRILRWKTSFSCKWKLSYTVVELLRSRRVWLLDRLRSRDLSRNRSSHRVTRVRQYWYILILRRLILTRSVID